jgi:hypothetical protein
MYTRHKGWGLTTRPDNTQASCQKTSSSQMRYASQTDTWVDFSLSFLTQTRGQTKEHILVCPESEATTQWKNSLGEKDGGYSCADLHQICVGSSTKNMN